MVKKSLQKRNFFKSAIFIIIGLLLIGFYAVWKFNQIYVAFTLTSDKIFSQTQPLGALPNKLIIPKVNANLDVSESVIKNGVWGVSDRGVSHLVTSGVPGQKANVVLYGHNKTQVLGNLFKIGVGDEIIIQTNDGVIHKYSVSKTQNVYPQDVWVLNDEDREQLILYTCTGFLDSQRFVIYADPISENR